MLTKSHFKDLITLILILAIFILAVFVIKPVIFSIIYGILLAYIFFPAYKWVHKKVKSGTLAAWIICIGILLIIGLFIFLLLTSVLKEILSLYITVQQLDIANTITQLDIIERFPISSEVSSLVAGSVNTAFSSVLAQYLGKLSSFVLNLPLIFLQLFIVLFTFFFALRDGEKAIEYGKSINLLKREVAEKFAKQFKDVTNAVIIGHVVVGVIQGLVAGIGYFVLQVPNAFLLTVLTIIVGIIPMVGSWLVWVPVTIYLFAIERGVAGFVMLLYGLIVINWIDNIIRPIIVSHQSKINSAIIIIGMFGGLLAFGVLGLIIGPLVLAYVLLIIELYRKGDFTETPLFVQGEEKK